MRFFSRAICSWSWLSVPISAAIAALSAADTVDQLQIARLKKRKLRLKDQIAIFEDYLTPDIIA